MESARAMTTYGWISGLAALLLTAGAAWSAPAPALPAFDFTKAEDVAGWRPTNDIGRLEGTPEGLAIEITGNDPYTVGPPRDFPAGLALWMIVRIKSDDAGTCQVFYYGRGASPTEENSVRFPVAGTGWTEERLPLPPLGPGAAFRIDPPGSKGKAVIASIRFEPRPQLDEPKWPQPTVLAAKGPEKTLTVGDATLLVRDSRPGDFAVTVGGKRMATGLPTAMVGYVLDNNVRWFTMDESVVEAKVTDTAAQHATVFTLRDPDGGTWRIEQTVRPDARTASFGLEVRVTVDKPREVVLLPMIALAAGAGSFGEAKRQGLFAGLEYLDNEPSSSEADIRGAASRRLVPDNLKITLPLAAIAAEDRYVALAWEPEASLAAVFDSPDRHFQTGGHVMGVICPGSDGRNRQDGSLMPYIGRVVGPNAPVVARGAILAGAGRDVTAAVQHYARLRGWPALPSPKLDWDGYARLSAGGWLDSKVREGNLLRHAVWPGFKAQPAADAAVWMEYLAANTKDAALAARLRETAGPVLAEVQPGNYYSSGVSHVRYPVVPLVHGHVAEAIEHARATGRGNLKRFEPDGSLLYRKSDDKPDYGSTHFSKEANGLASLPVATVLEAAVFTGDRALLQEGLRVLRALDKFAGTVPRGAQTWEVPLHTPDILASAYLVRAYTLGYEITGDPHFAEQARYWAWTGVPFVYLVSPAEKEVGPYSTVAVYGATSWVAPVWFGQPVQWCGLVYADALYRLAPYDAAGPWKTVADGITVAGIQHTWKQNDRDRQGLLPDFYHLRAQRSDGPAINPGTVASGAVRMYGRTPIYDYRVIRMKGDAKAAGEGATDAGRALFVHAPGEIAEAAEAAGTVTLRVRGWPAGPYYVLVSGLAREPKVRINGKDAPLTDPHQYLKTGNLILRVEGEAKVELVP